MARDDAPSGGVFHTLRETLSLMLQDLHTLYEQRRQGRPILHYGQPLSFPQPPLLTEVELRGVPLSTLLSEYHRVPMSLDAAIERWDAMAAIPKRRHVEMSVELHAFAPLYGLVKRDYPDARFFLAQALVVTSLSHGQLTIGATKLLLKIDGETIGLHGPDIVGHRTGRRRLGSLDWNEIHQNLRGRRGARRQISPEAGAVFIALTHGLPEMTEALDLLFSVVAWTKLESEVLKVFTVTHVTEEHEATSRAAINRVLDLIEKAPRVPATEIVELLSPRIGLAAAQRLVGQRPKARYTVQQRRLHRQAVLKYCPQPEGARLAQQRIDQILASTDLLKGLS